MKTERAKTLDVLADILTIVTMVAVLVTLFYVAVVNRAEIKRFRFGQQCMMAAILVQNVEWTQEAVQRCLRDGILPTEGRP